MRAGIALREDFTGEELRTLAKRTGHAGQSRRLVTLALIYDGGSRMAAARYAGVGLQTVRDWVLRFNARGPEGLIDGTAPGNRPKLDDAQRAALAAKVEASAERQRYKEMLDAAPELMSTSATSDRGTGLPSDEAPTIRSRI